MSSINLQDPGQIYVPDDLLASLGVAAKKAPTATHKAANAPSSGTELLTRVCGDSERTDHLTHAAGVLIAKGLSQDDVEFAMQAWNSKNDPPLAEKKITDTVASLFKTHERNHPAAPASSGPLEPLFDLAEADISVLLKTQPQPREWLLQDFLPLGVVGMVVAAGGVGKSQLLLQLGVSVASGLPLCDHWQVGQTGSALLLLAEDDLPEIHRRLDAIMTELAPKHPGLAQIVGHKLKVRSMTAQTNLMTVASGAQGVVTATDYVDRLLLVARQIPDLKLLVVDPASRFRGGNENSADDATRFIEQLERLAKELGITVLVAQHVNKAALREGDQSQSAARGSSALTDGVRWQMNLAKPNEKDSKKNYGIEPDQAYRYLIAKVTKNNYAAPQPTVVLRREDSRYLRSTQAAGIPVTLEERLVALIEREAKSGVQHTKNAIEHRFGGEQGPLKVGKNAVRAAIDQMVKSGELIKGKGGKLSVPAAAGAPSQVAAAVRAPVMSRPVQRVNSAELPNTPFFAGVPTTGLDPKLIEAISQAHESPMADGPMAIDEPAIRQKSESNQLLISDRPMFAHLKYFQ